MMSERPIRRALLSVSDKTGIVEFARALAAFGIEILSTGGTARTLRDAAVDVVDVDRFTGFPEMLDGRVKTLHPKVHAGILYRRDDPGHVAALNEHGLEPIDLVVVNLYPFVETISTTGVTVQEAVEQIDIGGPSMLRSAAKNHEHVTVVCRPDRYDAILEAMKAGNGGTTLALRRQLAIEVFAATHAYDGAISGYLADVEPAAEDVEHPDCLSRCLPRERALRYGENPHQRAAIYGSFLASFDQVHGKEISYNNIFDLCAALDVAAKLAVRGSAVAIIKHANPCGAAVGDSLASAWSAALACDPQAASGGIIACSTPVDVETAEVMSGHFIEVLVAPDFDPEALEILQRRKNRILLRRKLDSWGFQPGELVLRSVPGGIVAQTADVAAVDESDLRVVTDRAPTGDEMAALRFGWDVVRFVKSNAILYCGRDRLLGVGAGQMSRVDSARIAASKAARAGLDLEGSAVISDAFFPFADGLLVAVEAGATCAIQPGGSVRDDEVIAAANQHDIAMVFTGRRHFRH